MLDRNRIKQLEEAIFEANRFIKRAKEWKALLNSDPSIYSSKEGGACKRSSMDLSRALTKLRKPT